VKAGELCLPGDNRVGYVVAVHNGTAIVRMALVEDQAIPIANLRPVPAAGADHSGTVLERESYLRQRGREAVE
jgi:hypothetical protein